MNISVSHDLAALTGTLTRAQKEQLPFAIALALTETGKDVKDAAVAEMTRVFDRPTPFTLNSLFLKAATKQRLQAIVWFKDFAPKGTPAAEYLAPEIYGGGRRDKRSERLLQARGLMPRGWRLVPGVGLKLDQYGNISRADMVKILSALNAQNDPYQKSHEERAQPAQRTQGAVLRRAPRAAIACRHLSAVRFRLR
jgi:hypothetical protein